ncbi:hypothetical protein [Nocardioides zhouii]|uniref:DUF998 domain-containing protein n=1 Tax=Nocardioides zhouii TaxID=1168729 RepID=A0A4Q2T3Q4_9ACTN|nr:hypothetical protein [Nocardioides zhouii]RYC13385.1 hypothetical protein EUA94_05850 [Nocardioides zhouii]
MTAPTITGSAPPGVSRRAQPLLILGASAIFFPLVYLVSDFVEVAQGDFSTLRHSLTYAGEAGFPLIVAGLCALLHDRLPWWGLIGGIAYAYSFVFFTSTVVWAIVAQTPNWEVLSSDFGWWMTVHGAVIVVGGVAFGLGVARLDSDDLPAWTGYALALGVVLVAEHPAWATSSGRSRPPCRTSRSSPRASPSYAVQGRMSRRSPGDLELLSTSIPTPAICFRYRGTQ